MKRLLTKVFGRMSRTGRKRRTQTFRPRIEALEERALMSVGPEFHINTRVQFSQYSVDVASQPIAGGGSVVVWADQFNASGSDFDIRAQRFDGAGNKVGGEIVVASSLRLETLPSVAMNAQGNFVVVWTDRVSSTNEDIKGQRFFANGTRNGGVIRVTDNRLSESDPDVAVDQFGRFVVSWTRRVSSTNHDVLARRFSSNGAALSAPLLATSTTNEMGSSVAMSPDGRFSIAYQREQLNSSGPSPVISTDIVLQRFTAKGKVLSGHTIANSAKEETNPDVAMDRFGNTVVVWEHHNSALDRDIEARKVFNDGGMGLIMLVDSSTDFQFAPKVAMDLSDGDFVVAYRSSHNTGSTITAPHSLIVREMHQTGSILNLFNLGEGVPGAIAINDSDTYFVAYEAFNRPGDPEFGIFGRRGQLDFGS